MKKHPTLKYILQLTLISILMATLISGACIMKTKLNNTEAPTEPVIIAPENTFSEDAFRLEIEEYIRPYDYMPVPSKEVAITQQEIFNSYIKDLYAVLAKFDFHSQEYIIAYEMLNPEIIRAQAIIAQYNIDYKAFVEQEMIEAFWAPKAAEYPIATQVWRIMSEDFGWNDVVCAGLMGNFFAECGGCWTSDLDYQETSNGSVGLAQWLGSRRKSLYSIYGENPTVEEQMQFLYDEMHGTNGVNREITQKQYDAIMNAETPEECAYLFALYFERPNPVHIPPRKGYAKRAYEYFTN